MISTSVEGIRSNEQTCDITLRDNASDDSWRCNIVMLRKSTIMLESLGHCHITQHRLTLLSAEPPLQTDGLLYLFGNTKHFKCMLVSNIYFFNATKL